MANKLARIAWSVLYHGRSFARDFEAAKLVDDSGAMADEPAANPMQGLKIELLGALAFVAL
jgi:hypothetical protein